MKRRNFLGAVIAGIGLTTPVSHILTQEELMLDDQIQEQTSHSLVGTWDGITTFLSGSRKGQTQPIRITFSQDGTLLVETQNLRQPCVGTWKRGTYSFTELLIQPEGALVPVLHFVEHVDGKNLISRGGGKFFIINEQGAHFIEPSETEFRGKRVQG